MSKKLSELTIDSLDYVRRIRGNVHGSIGISRLEDLVISHPTLQRLRRIKQLAFLSYVFPGATHTRFEHSLGVMHLAGDTWQKMLANQLRLYRGCEKYDKFAQREKNTNRNMVHGLLAPTFDVLADVFSSGYTLQALRLAALMHDLGHPPFSHSGERFLPSWKAVRDSLEDQGGFIFDYLDSRCNALKEKGVDPKLIAVRHEVFTLLLVEKVFKEVYASGEDAGEHAVTARDVISIICPDIEPSESSILWNNGVYKLCHELISGELDLDRMDYLLRDSKECGVVYGIFDDKRIQDSLTIYHDPKDSSLHLAITMSGLAAFEDYLRARHSMYLQVYFHKTSVAAESMIQSLASYLHEWKLPVNLQEYIKYDEYSIGPRLLSEAESRLNAKDFADFSRILNDLLWNRRLWKRVYEVSTRSGQSDLHNVLEHAAKIIKEEGGLYEIVSTSNSLTTFRPREENETSKNYLRLIKKDEFQFPRVVPIEDQSNIVDNNDFVRISRIYVDDPKGVSLPKKIKMALRAKLDMGLS